MAIVASDWQYPVAGFTYAYAVGREGPSSINPQTQTGRLGVDMLGWGVVGIQPKRKMRMRENPGVWKPGDVGHPPPSRGRGGTDTPGA